MHTAVARSSTRDAATAIPALLLCVASHAVRTWLKGGTLLPSSIPTPGVFNRSSPLDRAAIGGSAPWTASSLLIARRACLLPPHLSRWHSASHARAEPLRLVRSSRDRAGPRSYSIVRRQSGCNGSLGPGAARYAMTPYPEYVVTALLYFHRRPPFSDT
ncbi:hypothetical protein PYCCODRAFT_1432205 [Trametes coccinea BRFM310]|uniref:Uncharacterized protein n=1 Tax=Trametes coccinea (strain BRFM310) TaxID=1353009 RepID=A0A1Y2IWY8_TRAC3|nr:hypothetical protein PYCCODRAFT_1432205 [Trametes coccinea BRFM310]